MTISNLPLSFDLLQNFNLYFQNAIQAALTASPFLDQILGYHLGWYDQDGAETQYNRGKQIRPLLNLLSCGAYGGDAADTLPLASAIELLHNFSLIHDDIMDDSVQRRGRDSVWRIWGENQAINAGDGAYGLSFQLLADAEAPTISPQTIVYAQRILSKACVDTVYGQMLDISFEDREFVTSAEYVQMTSLKTGPLLGAALGGGALYAGATWEVAQALCAIGRDLGVAFQIQDDILGIWGNTEQTGKSTDDDLTAKKKSFPIIWALENLPTSTTQKLRTLYQNEAPLAPEITSNIRDMLDDGGVEEAISTEVQGRYDALVNALETYYPKKSDYRSELFKIVAFIINRPF
jgi:geranylgeranyl diphosphate synthase type I